MTKKRFAASLLSAVLLAFCSSPAVAEVKLPAVFGSHMCLQREIEIPVWGWADAGEKVTVTLGEQSAEATAGDDGKWSVRLPAQKAGGPHDVVVKGSSEIKLNDVMIGEVWVCSGQSNMEWTMTRVVNSESEIENAKYPNIRLFKVGRATPDQPAEDCEGTWAACSPKTVANFSAVAYYFGRKIHEEVGVPVGLINTSWGGTLCEAWTSRDALEGDPDFAPILDRADRAKAGPNRAGVLYNGMIHPLIPFGIRGAIWYQGESNLRRAYQYRKLFPAMIRDWRKRWGQGDFPFYFVQLAPFRYRGQDQRNYAELCEAQRMTLSLPNTGMAVTNDIGNLRDIHPKNKKDVGGRLALWALAKDYGQKDLVYSGPLYKSMKVEGDRVRIAFERVGSGLASRDGLPLSDFTIAGKDRQFVPADAKIDGDTVVVSSYAIRAPVAVRFAWSDSGQPNLMNQEGLPASSFRTDDWPGATVENK